MKTLTGIEYLSIPDFMANPLTGSAFKTHATKSFLTEINPGHTRQRITECFGPAGIGWGLDFQPENIKTWETQTSGGKTRYNVAILYAEFWYMLDDSDNKQRFKISVTGGSDNDNLGDALSGARTSAIGQGVKELLFQIHIYKNEKPQTQPKKQPPKQQPAKFNMTLEKCVTAVNEKLGGEVYNVYHAQNTVNSVLGEGTTIPAPDDRANWEVWRDTLLAHHIDKKAAEQS